MEYGLIDKVVEKRGSGVNLELRRRVKNTMDGRKYGDGFGNLCCSFCGKNQREVKKLIAGPTVYICDECIELCNDIIAEEGRRRSPHAQLRIPSPLRSRPSSTST